MSIDYCPDNDQEDQWQADKEEMYRTWRVAQLEAALGWLKREATDEGDAKRRLGRLEKWFSRSFANEVADRYYRRKK